MSNAVTSNLKIASVLSEIGDADQGTLISLQLKKKGVSRGRAPERLTYNDDHVHVLLWSGFQYKDLVERSFKKLHQLWGEGNLAKKLLKATQDAGHPSITIEEVMVGIQEIEDSLLKIIQGSKSDEELPSIWSRLEVDGKPIRGAKVYNGDGNPNDSRSPVKGTVYIDGVKLGERIITPAPNGHWKSNQKPKTAAKNILRRWLPMGLYVSYSLEPDRLIDLKVGDEAGHFAKSENVPVDPIAIKSLFKISS